MNAPLTRDELGALGRISTPALANAIETCGVRPNTQGFTGPEIRPLFPALGTMVGYACTLRIAAADPRAEGSSGAPLAYWEYVARSAGPKVMVVQDLDPEPVGSFWGEVNANVHRALGCIGTVTHGGVRDLEEMEQVGFHAFASAVLVSHAYVHVVEFGEPVQIGPLTVRTGDVMRHVPLSLRQTMRPSGRSSTRSVAASAGTMLRPMRPGVPEAPGRPGNAPARCAQ